MPLEDNPKQTEKLNYSIILKCEHEYSKNGTMSCRKCGHANVS